MYNNCEEKNYDENVRVDKAAVISSKKMFEIIGQSRYYSRNKDLIYERNFENRFTENIFWIRVNKHFTSQYCYRINPGNYKICQVIYPVDPSKIIELNEKNIL